MTTDATVQEATLMGFFKNLWGRGGKAPAPVSTAAQLNSQSDDDDDDDDNHCSTSTG